MFHPYRLCESSTAHSFWKNNAAMNANVRARREQHRSAANAALAPNSMGRGEMRRETAAGASRSGRGSDGATEAPQPRAGRARRDAWHRVRVPARGRGRRTAGPNPLPGGDGHVPHKSCIISSKRNDPKARSKAARQLTSALLFFVNTKLKG